MRIAIIGAGNIGGTLGRKWALAGHEVRFGVRNPVDSKFDSLRAVGKVAPVVEALDGTDVVLLSMPGGAVADFAEQHGASLAGKIVIDSTNSIRNTYMNSLTVLKEKAPEAKLIRAFNALGWENFEVPLINGVQIDLFYCGHIDSRTVTDQLIADIGLRPIYIGDLDLAAVLDGMTRMWFALALAQGRGRRIAFKLLEE